MADRYGTGITVVEHSPEWARQFAVVASELAHILSGIPVESIEHVGSTSVPDLPAKPVLDIDIIVRQSSVKAAVRTLEDAGYRHRGNLGLPGREAFDAPDEQPERHVYLCIAGTLHVRNHLAVRDVLRTHPELRERYGRVKRQLASEPDMDIDRYIAGKSPVLQDILDFSDLTADEKRAIRKLNADPSS